MTNAYRKIGEGVTDSNGRITVSYTGKGAGKIQLVAAQDSLTSETYTITDALFISDGNLNCSSNAQVTIESDGYVLSPINTSNYGFVYFSTSNASSSWIRFDKESTVEFEVLSYTGTNTIRLDGNTTETIFSINATGKYRIVYKGTTTEIYRDDTLITTVNTTDETKNLRFRVNANSTLKIKNWLYY